MNTKNLLQYSLFEGFEEKEIKKFIEVIKIKHYKKNEMIIKENEIGDSIMLLFDGTVSITKALTIKMNKLQKREKEFRDKYMNIDYPASYQHVDDVIDPKDTRIMIIRGLEVLKNKEQSLPSKKHGNMPL